MKQEGLQAHLKRREIMRLALLVIMFILAACSTNVNAPYYRYSSKGGYNTQVVGSKCSLCGRVNAVSWNQIDHRETITCAYCGGEFNPKQGMAAHKYDSNQIRTQMYNNAIINSLGNMNNQPGRSPATTGCQYRTYTIQVNGTTKFCKQNTNCSVFCQ